MKHLFEVTYDDKYVKYIYDIEAPTEEEAQKIADEIAHKKIKVVLITKEE